jgi:signal transduction histidine kinase
VYLALDWIFAVVNTVVVVTLLATAVGTTPAAGAGIALGLFLFLLAPGLGRLERSRAASLLRVDVPSPHPPLTATTWWRRFFERLRTPSRWREIAYLSLHAFFAVPGLVVLALWSGALALIALPAYVDSLPGGQAHFWFFSLGGGAAAAAACAVGVVSLLFVLPWLTVAVALLSRRLVLLLGPRSPDELAAQVRRLEASRGAALDSAETERRRIERDLHDGAQQRLVALAMDLGRARDRFEADPDGARELVTDAHEEAKAALVELRNLVRGIHPAVLADRGLDAALSSVVARADVPIDLQVNVGERPPSRVESVAYFVVAEAVANISRHAHATRGWVTVQRADDRLLIEVTDDGVGGADPPRGTGLAGLADRVQAVDGWMKVLSPLGGPTSVMVELPCGS